MLTMSLKGFKMEITDFLLPCYVFYNIWKFLIAVAPPLLHAATWSASISTNYRFYFYWHNVQEHKAGKHRETHTSNGGGFIGCFS